MYVEGLAQLTDLVVLCGLCMIDDHDNVDGALPEVGGGLCAVQAECKEEGVLSGGGDDDGEGGLVIFVVR